MAHRAEVQRRRVAKERLPETGQQNKVASVKQESHRKFTVASFISLVLAIFTLLLWLATFWMNPWDQRISFTKNFHVGVWDGFSGDTLGRMVFFNDTNGPYRGSIISLTSTNDPPPVIAWAWHVGGDYGMGKEIDFGRKGEISLTEIAGEFPGVYYRHFRWPNEPQTLWTLMISLWYPFFLFSLLPVIWIFHYWFLRRSKSSPA